MNLKDISTADLWAMHQYIGLCLEVLNKNMPSTDMGKYAFDLEISKNKKLRLRISDEIQRRIAALKND